MKDAVVVGSAMY